MVRMVARMTRMAQISFGLAEPVNVARRHYSIFPGISGTGSYVGNESVPFSLCALKVKVSVTLRYVIDVFQVGLQHAPVPLSPTALEILASSDLESNGQYSGLMGDRSLNPRKRCLAPLRRLLGPRFVVILPYICRLCAIYQSTGRYRILRPRNYSIGNPTNRNPIAGGGSWSGVMSGVDLTEDLGHAARSRVQGEATTTMEDFALAVLDVEFINIANAVTGLRYDDMLWEGVPLNNGTFGVDDLQGQFYGPDHEEVGGLFYRNEITGAFGAKRQN